MMALHSNRNPRSDTSCVLPRRRLSLLHSASVAVGSSFCSAGAFWAYPLLADIAEKKGEILDLKLLLADIHL